MQTDRKSQIIAFAVSGALHVLLGIALVWASPRGSESRPASGGEPIVITLVPSDALASGGQPAARSEDEAPAEEEVLPTAPTGEKPEEIRGTAGRVTQLASETKQSGEAPFQAASGTEVETYQRTLLVHIERYRRYPEPARREHSEGIVVLRFLMDRHGNVLDAWVDRSSGFTILDAEAVAAVRRAEPLPAIPASLPDRLGIALPISFSLQ